MPSRREAIRLLVAIVLLPAGSAAQEPRTFADLRDFDNVVAKAMREWQVPGLAVGAVKDGQIVIAKGYGFRNVEAGLPVTSRTVMGIGSNSKSFTVVLMGMLADRKQLEWDRPVRNYLPDFRLYDEFATREMTPRDLVTHRSGLPRHDNLWYGRAFTREELYRRLRYLPPSASFRSRYQYQNLMFMTAGYLVERIAGRSWEDLIAAWIFEPLGMKRSSTSVRSIDPAGDVALPYARRNDSLTRLPYRVVDAIGPAGSINSSVDDMLEYVQFRIDRGTAKGQRLLSAEQEAEMQAPQMVINEAAESPEGGDASYGLGLRIGTFRGRKTVGHGGGIDGFISAMRWMPIERIGVVVLTNLSGENPVPWVLVHSLFDRLLDVPPVDWIARQKETDAGAATRRTAQRERIASQRKPGTAPSHPISAYLGTYQHPAYGSLVVRQDGSGLAIVLEPHVARLEHYHHDVWHIRDSGGVVPFTGLVRFETDPKGKVRRVLVPLEPAVAPIEFVRD